MEQERQQMHDEEHLPRPSGEQTTHSAQAQAPSPSLAPPGAAGIAERLRAARLAAGLTQQALAGQRFSKSYISAIECGKMTPSFQALGILAARLGQSIASLLGEEEMERGVLPTRSSVVSLQLERSNHQHQEEMQQRLSQAEAFLRQDQPGKAFEHLGRNDEPPPDIPLVQRLHWYRLAGWAAGLEERPDDAITLLEHGVQLAEQLRIRGPRTQYARLPELIEWFHCFLGNAYCARSEPERAYQLHQRGLTAISARIVTDPELTLLIYRGLGHDALALGRYKEAISYYQQALKQASDVANPRQQGIVYWGMGWAYQELSDLFRAKTSYQHALQALGEIGNLPLLAQIRLLLGLVLIHLEEYEEAGHHLRLSLEGAKRLDDRRIWGNALGNLALLARAKGDLDQAIELAKEGIQLAQQSGDHRNEGQVQLTLALAYQAKQDSVATEHAFQEALQIFSQIPDLDMLGHAHEHYAGFLATQGRYQEACAQMLLTHPIHLKEQRTVSLAPSDPLRRGERSA